MSTDGRGSPRVWFVVLSLLLAALIAVVVIRGQGASPASASAPTTPDRTFSPLGAASSTASPTATSPAPPSTTQPVVRLYSAHGEASLIPALEGQRPLFILSLGSDARPGQDIEKQRSDSIHIIGVDLASRRATILGFPRDSYVPIPGHGTGKINGAMSAGGPQLLIQTLEQLTGIHIDFWMLTSFPGIVSMVNGVGGLVIDVPYPMHDAFSHANFEPGVTHINGKQALAFARDRHDVPGGDLGRSKDQGLLLLSALTAFRAAFARDPGAAFTWMQTGWNQIRTNLSVATLLDLALTASQIAPSDVNNVVVPATGGIVGGLSVVFLTAASKTVFADLRDDGVIEHPPA